MFLSTFEGVIDTKGRVSVPAPFRAALGGTNRVYIWPAFDGRYCLEAGGDQLMQDYRQILARMSPHDPAREAIAHSIFGRSAELKMDDPGRIKLPEPHLKAAGITDRLVFSGAFDRFRIWNPARFSEYDAEMVSKAAESRAQLEAPFQAALSEGVLDTQTSKTAGTDR